MDERTALAATGLEAFETAEPRSPNWTDADRAWAELDLGVEVVLIR